jgi:hypothetical protein
MGAPVLLVLGEYRWDLFRLTMAAALVVVLGILLAAPPGGWTIALVLRSIGGLVFILAVLALLWVLLVVPHPLRLTETGVARWPLVCVLWDEIEYYAITNIGVNGPVMTLQLLSKRTALPMLPPQAQTSIRLTEDHVQRIRRIMEQKGVPEYPY